MVMSNTITHRHHWQLENILAVIDFNFGQLDHILHSASFLGGYPILEVKLQVVFDVTRKFSSR